MNILFINVCVRKESRTLRLAKHLLARMEGEVTELNLEKERIEPLNGDTLAARDRLLAAGEYDAPMLRYARQLAQADAVVIAAPFWELSFPSMLKVYLEAVAAVGVTFRYEEGHPVSLCRAKRLIYVTTCGGPYLEDFGFGYVRAMAQGFFGIEDVRCVHADMLDVDGMDVEKILEAAQLDAAAAANE